MTNTGDGSIGYALIMGGGGLVAAVISVTAQIRSWRHSKKKEEQGLNLDQTTERKIAADAAKINADQTIEQERWWKEQFDASKEQLKEERSWRLRALKRWRQHDIWDEELYKQARRAKWRVRRAPPLDPDEDWDEESWNSFKLDDDDDDDSDNGEG